MARKPAEEGTAYHEAGHAAVSHFLGRPVRAVALTPGDPDRLAYAQYYKRPAELVGIEFDAFGLSSWKAAVPRLMVLIAGQLAEEMVAGRRNRVGAGSDDRQFADLISRVTGDDEEGSALARWTELRTRNLLNVPIHWCAVRRVAAALLENGKRTAKPVRRDRQQGVRPANHRSAWADGSQLKGWHPGGKVASTHHQRRSVRWRGPPRRGAVA